MWRGPSLAIATSAAWVDSMLDVLYVDVQWCTKSRRLLSGSADRSHVELVETRGVEPLTSRVRF